MVDAIEGLPERWGQRAHGFYTPDSALALADALDRFEGGDLLVDIAEMPIKCPVAPLEFVCLVDEYLTQRGIRSRTRLTLMTPLSGAFTKPVCNDMLTGMLVAKGVQIVAECTAGRGHRQGRGLPRRQARALRPAGDDPAARRLGPRSTTPAWATAWASASPTSTR